MLKYMVQTEEEGPTLLASVVPQGATHIANSFTATVLLGSRRQLLNSATVIHGEWWLVELLRISVTTQCSLRDFPSLLFQSSVNLHREEEVRRLQEPGDRDVIVLWLFPLYNMAVLPLSWSSGSRVPQSSHGNEINKQRDTVMVKSTLRVMELLTFPKRRRGTHGTCSFSLGVLATIPWSSSCSQQVILGHAQIKGDG